MGAKLLESNGNRQGLWHNAFAVAEHVANPYALGKQATIFRTQFGWLSELSHVSNNLVYVRRLKLENIKHFSSLDLDFRRPDGSLKGWNVVVGGNSSGKTTILKAISLALCGPEAGRQLLRNTAGWITRGEKKASANIDVEWTSEFDHFKMGGKHPGESFKCGVRWFMEGDELIPQFKDVETRTPAGGRVLTCHRGPWDANAAGWFCCGYGPMRRLTGSSPDAMRDAVGGGKVGRFVSLFREDVALSESEEWLKKLQFRNLEGDEEAGTLVTQIVAFLNDDLLPSSFQISKITSDHVFVTSNAGLELPIRDFSDGCRSVYALMLDILNKVVDVYGASDVFSQTEDGRFVVNKPGVILIDEVEAHLHPRWQRTICDWLKTRFPLMQFFVTSHSPLILQAADPGGIFVLPLESEAREPRKLDEHEYERIVLGRAEKVLLGEAFGLSTTRGQWANQLIERFRTLDAKKRAGALNSPSEQRVYAQLELQMQLAYEDDSEAPKHAPPIALP